jgi:hypothetical protein
MMRKKSASNGYLPAASKLRLVHVIGVTQHIHLPTYCLLPKAFVSITANLSLLPIFHLDSEMASEHPNPDSASDPYKAPALALKQALCFSCWDVSSNLSRCSACKRVSYCSVKCQKQDWNRNHKKICKKLVASNKRKGYVPSAGRHWDDYYDEQVHYLAPSARRASIL